VPPKMKSTLDPAILGVRHGTLGQLAGRHVEPS
jgi:hypothetical protein